MYQNLVSANNFFYILINFDHTSYLYIFLIRTQKKILLYMSSSRYHYLHLGIYTFCLTPEMTSRCVQLKKKESFFHSYLWVGVKCLIIDSS